MKRLLAVQESTAAVSFGFSVESACAELSWESCLCHCVESQEKPTPFSAQSWRTLFSAARVRQDSLWDFLSRNECTDASVRGWYHRRCYSTYTNKTCLSRLSAARKRAQPESSSDSEDHVHAATRSTRSTVPSVSADVCLICNQRTKKVKGKRQPLTQCQSLTAGDSILDAAELANDSKVLISLQGGPDCVAAEIKYHRACYSAYTHPSTLQRRRNEATGDEPSVYDIAFERLALYITSELQLSKALAVNVLTDR